MNVENHTLHEIMELSDQSLLEAECYAGKQWCSYLRNTSVRFDGKVCDRLSDIWHTLRFIVEKRGLTPSLS